LDRSKKSHCAGLKLPADRSVVSLDWERGQSQSMDSLKAGRATLAAVECRHGQEDAKATEDDD
jgi:hypothetical protein